MIRVLQVVTYMGRGGLETMLMNYYRWSAVCGIGEMVIFALVLKKVKQDTNEEFSIKSGKTMNDSELRGSYEKSM